MNIQEINILKEMVDYYEQDIQWLDESYDKVNCVRGLLSDLENQIPTERQLELENKILNFEHLIKQKQLVLRNLNFYQTDGCSEVNSISDLEHEIKTATDELKQIHMDKLFGTKEETNE